MFVLSRSLFDNKRGDENDDEGNDVVATEADDDLDEVDIKESRKRRSWRTRMREGERRMGREREREGGRAVDWGLNQGGEALSSEIFLFLFVFFVTTRP